MDHEPVPVMVPKLQDEIWFHGGITRLHAEALLKHVSWLLNISNFVIYLINFFMK